MTASKHRRGHRTVVAVGSLPPPPDGQSVAFGMLVRELDRRGVSVSIIDIAQTRSPAGELDRRRHLLRYARLFPLYAYSIARLRPMVVYLTVAQSRAGFLRDAVFVWIARLLRRRLVAHLHGGNYDVFFAAQPFWLQRVIRGTLRQLDAMIVLGESLRSMFHFEPAVQGRVRVVPNGLPSELERPLPAKRLPGAGSEPLRLLYLSNLVESKGYFDVLEAVRLLIEEHGLAVRGDFCGRFLTNPSDDRIVRSADHARSLFDAFVEQHDLHQHVTWHGVVSGARKIEMLSRAHIFVLPTWYDNEGQPISIIEAMAFGCPVISTRYRAIPELVDCGTTGFLVAPRRPDQIAQSILRLAQDPESFRRMSEASLQRYQERFSARAHLDKMLEVLDIGEPHGSR